MWCKVLHKEWQVSEARSTAQLGAELRAIRLQLSDAQASLQGQLSSLCLLHDLQQT